MNFYLTWKIWQLSTVRIIFLACHPIHWNSTYWDLYFLSTLTLTPIVLKSSCSIGFYLRKRATPFHSSKFFTYHYSLMNVLAVLVNLILPNIFFSFVIFIVFLYAVHYAIRLNWSVWFSLNSATWSVCLSVYDEFFVTLTPIHHLNQSKSEAVTDG